MASGDTLCIFTPLCNEQPSSNPATFDARNAHPCLDFDDTTNETAIFSGVMPQNYDGGGVTVYLHYAMSTATADTVDWYVAFDRIGDKQLDIDSESFAAVNSVDDTTVPGTSGNVDIVSVAFTDGADMDSVAAGEKFKSALNGDYSKNLLKQFDDINAKADKTAQEIAKNATENINAPLDVEALLQKATPPVVEAAIPQVASEVEPEKADPTNNAALQRGSQETFKALFGAQMNDEKRQFEECKRQTILLARMATGMDKLTSNKGPQLVAANL